MTKNFNTQANTREFIEEVVKKANKKYKWSRGAPYRTTTLHFVADECKVSTLFF